MSVYCELAIQDALKAGKALLKFISANNVGKTGSHETGYLLPNPAWHIFSPFPPVKGENKKNNVKIRWQGDFETDSVVTWYGRRKYEYRLTRFGRGFPFLDEDCLGSLLVIIPFTLDYFHAYVLDLEDDIEEIQLVLGTYISGSSGIYIKEFESEPLTPEKCINQMFREFTMLQEEFPTGNDFSRQAQKILLDCIDNFSTMKVDTKIIKLVDYEYLLYQMVERKICQNDIIRQFKDIDDFIKTASAIMNRRKSRAGKSFENHAEYIFKSNSLNFDSQPAIDGKPDFIFPSVDAYNDTKYPSDKLISLALKRTCKDRWRQILDESKRTTTKHLMTLQHGISRNQINKMYENNVILVVPKQLHTNYPQEYRGTLLTVEDFIKKVKSYGY